MTIEQANQDMQKRKVVVKTQTKKILVEESPYSYKNIDEVIKITAEAKLSKPVARLNPKIVITG